MSPKWRPMSRCGSSLRGRGVRRKRKPSPIFPNSTAQFHHPQMAASPPPPSAPWKIMPVSWEYCLWLYNERLCFWLVGVHTWPFWEPGDGVSSIRIFSESGMVWSPWKEEVLYLEVGNRWRKKSKRCLLTHLREQFWAFNEIDTPVQVPSPSLTLVDSW